MSSQTFGVGTDDLVTGEAVALELPPAGFAVRTASGLIDLAVLAALWAAGGTAALTVTAGTSTALRSAAFLAATVLVLVGVPTASETLTRGRTLGKLALGTRTVRDDAGPIQFRHALTRALVAVVEIWLLSGAPALVSALVSSKGKRLGDYAAGTYVVRERVRLTLPAPPAMPAHLAAWAAGADITALPDSLAMAVRQFLSRAPGLSPESRAMLGAQLYADLSPHVAPSPPAGSHPEHVMAAVIAQRRSRDAERLRREAELRRRLLPADPMGPFP